VKRRAIAPATLAKPSSPEPETVPDNNEDAPTNWRLQVGEGSEAHVIYPREDHEMVCVGITRAKEPVEWHIQLNRTGLKVTSGRRYALAFSARAERPRTIGVGFAKAYDPWSSLGIYTHLQLSPEWQSFHEEFTALEDEENARIHFDLGGKDIGVDFTNVSLKCLEEPGEQMAPAPAMAGDSAAGSHV